MCFVNALTSQSSNDTSNTSCEHGKASIMDWGSTSSQVVTKEKKTNNDQAVTTFFILFCFKIWL
jgi:hypothetical protein